MLGSYAGLKATLVGGLGAIALLSGCGGGSESTTTTATTVAQTQQTSPFGADSATITNRYLPITKFRRCVLAGTDQGQHLRVVRVLQKQTKPFPYKGRTVKAAVVVDRVTDVRAGQLIEKTIDYFAQDRAGAVYYFGEDVNEYQNGKLAGHSGQWRVGRDAGTPGVLMPARPKVGDTYYAEHVPGITVERDRVIASGLTEKFGGHHYPNVIKIREHATTPKPADFEFKTYAPDVGVITEANGGLHLVGCS